MTALAAYESYQRKQHGAEDPYIVSDAVDVLVKYRKPIDPDPAWQAAYARGLNRFEERLQRR